MPAPPPPSPTCQILWAEDLAGISRGLAFCGERGINLVERAVAGTYLTWDELSAFANSCRETERGQGWTLAETAAIAFNAFVHFVSWRTETIVVRANAQSQRAAILGREQFDLRARSVAPKPSSNTSSTPGEPLGLMPRQRELLLSVTSPGDPRNPFQSKLQFRNFAIVLTTFRLGIRAGELLALKSRDLRLGDEPPTMTIHRRHNDPEDPRKRQPVVKTRARVIVLDPELRDTLSDWILNHRSDRKRFPCCTQASVSVREP